MRFFATKMILLKKIIDCNFCLFEIIFTNKKSINMSENPEKKSLKIHLAQINFVVGDLEGNFEKIPYSKFFTKPPKVRFEEEITNFSSSKI